MTRRKRIKRLSPLASRTLCGARGTMRGIRRVLANSVRVTTGGGGRLKYIIIAEPEPRVYLTPSADAVLAGAGTLSLYKRVVSSILITSVQAYVGGVWVTQNYQTTGQQIRIIGSGFGSTRGTSRVLFGTTEAASYVSWSATSITVVVPVVAPGVYALQVSVGAEVSNAISFTVYTTILVSSLSTSHTSIGAQLTISGSGFGASRGTNRVWFGELPQYTFSDGKVLRPCSREAASYVSWSDTQVVVTVPNMAPGLAGAPGTYHNVYVEVGGVPSNAAAFYIDPVTTLDASSSLAAWRAVFPNLNVGGTGGGTLTVTDTTYTNSTAPYTSQHSSYTTHVTMNATSAVYANAGNYVADGTHDVLIKDVTFRCDNPNMPGNIAGVLTIGGQPGGPENDPSAFFDSSNIYNLTFHNCVILNNTGTGNATGPGAGEGVNACKSWHGSGAGGRWGDWTFSDISFGTPNTPGGAFMRASIECGEPQAAPGLSHYDPEPTPNYLQNVRITGCDFETCGWHSGYSQFTYGNAPLDRRCMVDHCTFKGNAIQTLWNRVTGLEIQTQGFYVADCDFWRTGGLWLQLEGGENDMLSNSPSYTLFRRCNFDYTIEYGTVSDANSTWNCAFGAGSWNGTIFDDCDINMGTASEAHQSLFWPRDANGCTGFNLSTSYLHGYARPNNGSPAAVTSLWVAVTDWITQTPAASQALCSDNFAGLPTIGDRP